MHALTPPNNNNYGRLQQLAHAAKATELNITVPEKSALHQPSPAKVFLLVYVITSLVHLDGRFMFSSLFVAFVWIHYSSTYRAVV